jgi:hypothetical protein
MAGGVGLCHPMRFARPRDAKRGLLLINTRMDKKLRIPKADPRRREPRYRELPCVP